MLQFLPLSRYLLCFAHGTLLTLRIDDNDRHSPDSLAFTVNQRQWWLSIHPLLCFSLAQAWPLAAAHPSDNDRECLLICTVQSVVLRLSTQSPRSIDILQGVRCAEPSLLCCASFAPHSCDLVAVGTMFGNLMLWNTVSGAVVQSCSGHEGSVRCVQWSADARTILTASEDRSVRVWRADANGLFVCESTLYGHDGRVWSCSLYPSGDAFCSAGEDGGVRHWLLRDAATPTLARADVCHAADVWQVDSCAFGDGLVLMASVARDGTVRVARSAPASPLICDNALFDETVHVETNANVSAVRVCPWTATLFVGFASGHVARVVDRRVVEPLGEYGGRGISFLGVCDGGALLLVCTNVGDFVVVRMSDAGVMAERRGAHRERIRFCAAERVHDDSIVVLSSAQGDEVGLWLVARDGTVSVIRRAALSSAATTSGNFGAVCLFSAAFVLERRCVVVGDSSGAVHLVGVPINANSTVWSAAIDNSGDNTVSLRSVHGGDRVTAIQTRCVGERAIVATTFGRDGFCVETIFSIDDIGAIRGTILRRFRLLAGVLSPTHLLRCESVHGGAVAVLHGRTFAAVDVASGYAHAGAVSEAGSLGVVYDCSAVSGVLWALHPTTRGALRVAATRIVPPLLPLVHSQYIDAAHSMSPQLGLAVTGGEDTRVGVWDTSERRLLYFLHSHSGAVFCFADDGAATLLSGGARGTVCEHLFDRSSGTVRQCNVNSWVAIADILGRDCRVISLAAWRLASATLRVYIGTADGRLLCAESTVDGVRTVGAMATVRSAVFSMAAVDGARVLFGAADGAIRVLNVDSGALVRLEHGHQSGVTALCVTMLGDGLWRVCSGGDDQALLAVDYESSEWRCVRVCRVALAHGGAVRGVEFADNACVVVTASADERVAVWRLTASSSALAIARVSVQLSGVEETSGMSLIAAERSAVLVVGNGATFVPIEFHLDGVGSSAAASSFE